MSMRLNNHSERKRIERLEDVVKGNHFEVLNVENRIASRLSETWLAVCILTFRIK